MSGLWYLPFLAILGGISFVFIFIFPKVTFLFLVVMRIIIDLLHWVPLTIFNLNVLAIYSGAAAIVCIIVFFIRFRNDLEHHKCIHFFILWNLMILIHILLADFNTRTIDETFRSFSPVLILMIGSSMLTKPKDGVKVFLLIAITGLIPIIISLYYWQIGQMDQAGALLKGIPRLLGGYKNLRHHALIMMILTGVGCYFFFYCKKLWQKVFWMAYIFSSATCMYLTMIRSCLLVGAIYLFIFFWISNRKYISALAFIIILVAMIFNTTLQERFKDLVLVFTLSAETDIESLSRIGSGRYGMWTESWIAYQERPILQRLVGLGFGEHYELIRNSFFAFDAKSTRNLDTHNDLLRMLYNLGPIALIAYLGMAFKCLNLGRKINRYAPTKEERDLGAMCACIMLGLLLNNCLSNGTFSRTTIGWLFWLFGGILFGLIKGKQIQNQKKLSDDVEQNYGS